MLDYSLKLADLTSIINKCLQLGRSVVCEMFNVYLKSLEKTFMFLIFVSIVSQLYIFVLILTFPFITVIFPK